ncbi:MAG: M20 family metallopeptidase [Bacteroidota bacterium]
MHELAACVSFLQRLIQTPSLPGKESQIAQLVVQEMTNLDYDNVYIDDAGNVIGHIHGSGEAPAMMLNTHLDHVDVGDHSAWPFPPFEGKVHDAQIWGRGAVDIKGPLASQVYAGARLLNDSNRPPGDVYVTAVVFEELGGLGARHMATHLCPELVVIGEPSGNALRRGHRGRLEIMVHAKGKSAHASVPHLGINPLDSIAAFILAMEHMDMAHDVDLGTSTVAKTIIKTDQISTNVIPAEAWLTLDWRNVPAESEADIITKLQTVLEANLQSGASASVALPRTIKTCYTGYQMEIPANAPSFVTRADDTVLLAAIDVLQNSMQRPMPAGIWNFATDAGHFVKQGATCIGIGPGDDKLAHTIDERIPVSQVEEALSIYEALSRHWPARVTSMTPDTSVPG